MLLEVDNLRVSFPVRGGSLLGKTLELKALDGVNLSLKPGEILGLVGESGCGKSTLGRAIVRLLKPKSGTVKIKDRDINSLGHRELRKFRKHFQMIFQDPYGSLNPRMTVGEAVSEVLKLHSKLGKSERSERVAELFGMVGLPAERASDYPHQFSGGQRQRIGIARALAADPELIVADEPVSALDVSVQAQIINLLQNIRREKNTGFLFIAHDLALVKHISDRIAVMYLGRIVESGDAREVCDRPLHPYTQALLSAVPRLHPEDGAKRIILPGDVPSPINPPSGCSFHPRCPNAQERCRLERPELTEKTGSANLAACHFPLA